MTTRAKWKNRLVGFVLIGPINYTGKEKVTMKITWWVIVCVSLIAVGCAKNGSETNGYENGSYEAFGLDSARINELITRIENRTYANIHSLLIMKNGSMAVERYFSGYGPEQLHMLQSVTKSFTSAMIGIALDKEIIAGTETRILDFFGQYTAIANMNDWKRAIRINDILTMRTGVDYSEGYDGSPHSVLSRLPRGWDLFYLNRPMSAAPGTVFNYDSGGVILLSAILHNACGMHADVFADQFLFPQLGITQKRWFRNAEGHPHTGGGLSLLPRDMAKFGQLYLSKGRWQGRQLVPESWVERSFEKSVAIDQWGTNIVGYGYLWWIFRPANRSTTHEFIYAAMGAYGQYIFVIPEYDMVVVVTSGTVRDAEFANPQNFLYSHILDAVR
jgi:CubicO group peptidase (beta-lactamase class C family)